MREKISIDWALKILKQKRSEKIVDGITTSKRWNKEKQTWDIITHQPGDGNTKKKFITFDRY